MFHTALASGATAGFPPLAAENRGTEPLPLPVFAISRGRADRVAEPGGGVLELELGLSLGFGETEVTPDLAARKVLLTETALKVAGFLTEDPERAWDLSSSFSFEY